MSLKYAILALLYQGEIHGYELGKQLALTLKSDWEVKLGQIPITLQRLEQAGFVSFHMAEADAAPERKIYRLTDAGLQALAEWYTEGEVRDYRMSDSFYLKLVFSLLDAPISPEQVLVAQKRRLYQELHDVMQVRNETNPQTNLPLFLMLETVVAHIEADIHWLDMCAERLDELKNYRPPHPSPQPRGRPKQSKPE